MLLVVEVFFLRDKIWTFAIVCTPRKMLPWDRFKSLTQSTILPLRAIGSNPQMGQKKSHHPRKVVQQQLWNKQMLDINETVNF